MHPMSGPRPGVPWPPEQVPALIAWLSLPKAERSELIGGRLVRKVRANFDHGAAQIGVAGQLFRYQGPSGPGSRWWLSAEVDIYVGGEGLRPDLAGWRIERHPVRPTRVNVGAHLGVIVDPPDWVCEVLSPSTASRDRGAKLRAYHRAGVEWYWVVDLFTRSVTVFQRTAKSYEVAELVEEGSEIPLAPFVESPFVLASLFVGCEPH